MNRVLLLGLLALPSPVLAQVVVRAPGVHVEVGPAVIVRAFGVEVFVPRRVPNPPGVPVPPAMPPAMPPAVVDPSVPPVPTEEDKLVPIPVPSPKAAPATKVAMRPITPSEFVGAAKPFKPGAYKVVFLHPHTNQPIEVNFDLPVSPRKVSGTKTRIDFKWGLFRSLSLHFEPDGTVLVRQS